MKYEAGNSVLSSIQCNFLLAIAALIVFYFLPVNSINADFETPPLRVCLVSGSAEYNSDASLTAFKTYLESNYNIECTLLKAIGFEQLPGLEALEDCDAALFFTRRLLIDGEQLEMVKNYCKSGNAIVAVRTASHGFQNWLEFDKEILGGNYHNHFGNGPTMEANTIKSKNSHPILDGIGTLYSRYSLYKTGPISDDADLLMTATIPTQKEPQPAAWTRTINGGRVFYTQLGGVEDFENASFKRMLANALYWTSQCEVERSELEIPEKRTRPKGTLQLKLRSREESTEQKDQWEEINFEQETPVAKTAIIICDMWDKHWCNGATERCEVIAQKMNKVVNAARDRGIQIIHAPSDTLSFYLDWPQRRRMQLARVFPLPEALDIPTHPLPIDDSDGGCDTDETPWYHAWTRQSKHIDIGKYDGISDNGREVYNFIEQEGIDTLLIMGVHTNMCILGRSFAIRQMTRWGKKCILVRDLTDAMYDPKDSPQVSHDAGTQLVIEHIEKYWCPTIISEDLVEGLQ